MKKQFTRNKLRAKKTILGLQCQTPLKSYPLTLDHWLFTLDPWPLAITPHHLSLIPTPCSFSLNTYYCSFQENLCGDSPFVFLWRSSSIEGSHPSKAVFHRRLSSIEGRLPSPVVFHWRSCFHRRLSSINSSLPLMVIYHQWSSSIKGCPPS